MHSGDAREKLFSPDPARIPWFLPLATLTVFLLWRGYSFGNGDQDVFLPTLLHLLDPDLFGSDWFVSTQLQAIGPRTGFVLLTYLPAKLLGPFTAYACLWIVCWFAIASAAFTLSWLLTADRIAAAGTVVALLLVTPRVTLGSNDVMLWQFVPSIAGWALALWGVVMHVRRRPIRAAWLFGIAAWVQALIGLHMAFVCGVMMIWDRRPPSSMLRYGATFALVSAIAIAPQVMQQWSASSTEPSLFHILFEFRAPHHYLFTRFVQTSAVAYGILTVMALLCLRTLGNSERVLPVRLLAVTGVLCLVGYVGTELLRSEFIGKLQLFRTTVFAKVILVVIICTAVSRMLPPAVQRWLEHVLDHSRYLLAGAVLLTTALIIASPSALGFRPLPVTGDSPAEIQIAAWAHSATAPGSIFAVPPSWEHFRIRAQRGIVVNFKAIPFTAAHALQWYRRLQAVAPVGGTGRGTTQRVVAALDSAFFALPPEKIRQLSSRYGFTYVVRKASPDPLPADFVRVYAAGNLVTYRIPAP